MVTSVRVVPDTGSVPIRAKRTTVSATELRLSTHVPASNRRSIGEHPVSTTPHSQRDTYGLHDIVYNDKYWR